MDIITDKAVQVTSGGSVTINSGDHISMTNTNNFSIHAEKSLFVNAGDSITMTCHENSMKFETPATGIEISVSKPIKVTGGNTVDISSGKAISINGKNKMDIKSTQAMNLFSYQDVGVFAGKRLSLSAFSAIEEEGKGSLMKLDGNIDIKATLIKEN